MRTEHIWFANQVPEYACASIAILNIVNNIPHIDLGKELRDFKEFTKEMDPLMRGDAIDSFDFVKRIHNSFARENDMLNADMVTQGKVRKARKDLAKEKARETREARKTAKAMKGLLDETSANARPAANGNGSPRRPAARRSDPPSAITAARKRESTVLSSPSDSSEDIDGDYTSNLKVNNDGDTQALAPLRKSARAPKPRKVVTAADYGEPDAGFHYVAYMPIGDNVWKLDGMDRNPQDLGPFKQGSNVADGGSGDWLDVVTPMIQNRMSQHGDDLNFSLMAVVRDPFFDEQRKLLENIKALQAMDFKLDSSEPEWKSFNGGETGKDVLTGISIEFEIMQKDVDDTELPASVKDLIASEDDVLRLIEYRKGLLREQTMLRSGLRDTRRNPKEEDDARLKKHDYGPFVREWLGALADDGVLQNLLV